MQIATAAMSTTLHQCHTAMIYSGELCSAVTVSGADRASVCRNNANWQCATYQCGTNFHSAAFPGRPCVLGEMFQCVLALSIGHEIGASTHITPYNCTARRAIISGRQSQPLITGRPGFITKTRFGSVEGCERIAALSYRWHGCPGLWHCESHSLEEEHRAATMATGSGKFYQFVLQSMSSVYLLKRLSRIIVNYCH